MGGEGKTSKEPTIMDIRVGILTAKDIEWKQGEHSSRPTFILSHVPIGIGFHWGQTQEQEFAGQLDIINNADGTQTAVNTLDIEDYITSVISSEMSADSPIELLKAHAIISRSWAVRAITANRMTGGKIRSAAYESNGHTLFDVCADDHCQRYEGIRLITPRAQQAIEATRGKVLTYNNQVCDTRFYKCCGGKTEVFATCWEDIDVPYLQSVECPYCQRAIQRLKNNDKAIKQCLMNYDQQTVDAHDWNVIYRQDELKDILLEKTGIDFGTIENLIPLRRGQSGRIYELEIVGSRHRQVIGKELKIRRALSRTCLYSSWFDIEKKHNDTGTDFVFQGHGWGHGVGLCQLGAAEMALEGFTYNQILQYYYPDTQIQ